MTAFSLLLIGAIIISLLLAVFLWPSYKSRTLKNPPVKKAVPDLLEEYSEELTHLDKPINVDPVPELPQSYGIDRLVLLVKDPYWVYAYWEVTATKMEEFASSYGDIWNNSKSVMRVYDITGVVFNGNNAHGFFDIPINDFADNWHIEVGNANRTYCADLGRLLPNGNFIAMLRSNSVTTPRDSLSDNMDEEWMWIEGIYRTVRRQTGVSSLMIVKEINERMANNPLGFSSPGFDNLSAEKEEN